VRRTIQFNRDVALHTEKVDNIATYAVSPPKFFAEDLSTLQVPPQDSFRRSGIVSQFFAALFQGRDINQIEVSLSHTCWLQQQLSDLPCRADYLR
jgi:hypothetical protein